MNSYEKIIKIAVEMNKHGFGEVIFDIKPEFYHKGTKTFSFEVSDIPRMVSAPSSFRPTSGFAKAVYLRNPKTGQKMKFVFTHPDMDSTQEDTYGWNYKSEDGQYKLLIIND
jgi:hypothetical protein